MSEELNEAMLVDCSSCLFSRIVTPEDDELPADVVIEHGKETGHTLSTSPVTDERQIEP